MTAEVKQKFVCIACSQWKPLVSFHHRDEQGSITGQIYCCEDCIDFVADRDIEFKSRLYAQKPTDEEIKAYCKEQEYYGHCHQEYLEGIEQGAKWMREQFKPVSKEQHLAERSDAYEFLIGEPKASQWISVEDRLPVDDPTEAKAFNLLIRAKNERYYTGYSVTEDGKTDFYQHNGRRIESVTHWQPLLDPPE